MTTGNELAKLTASDAATDEYFGWSVGISGNTAIVGATIVDSRRRYSGEAYLLIRRRPTNSQSSPLLTPRRVTSLAGPSPSAATPPSSGHPSTSSLARDQPTCST